MATQVFRVKTRAGEWSNLIAHIDGVIRPITSDGGECRILVPANIDAAKNFIADQDAKLTLQRQTTRQGGRKPNPVADMIFALPTETNPGELTSDQLDEWSHGVVDWVKKRFPASHIVNANLHLDESTPHMHVMIVPVGHHNGRWGWNATFKDAIEDITGKAVNKHPNRLEIKSLMSKMQDDCWDHCGKPFGLARGEPGKNYREQIDRKKGLERQREKAEAREEEIRKKEAELRRLSESIRRDEELLAKRKAKQEAAQKKRERQIKEAANELGKYLVALMFFLQRYYEKQAREPSIADLFILVFEAVKDSITPPKIPRARQIERPDNVPDEPYISLAVLQRNRSKSALLREQLYDQVQALWDAGGNEIASRWVDNELTQDLDPGPVEPDLTEPVEEKLDDFTQKANQVLDLLKTHPDKREPVTPPEEPVVEHVDEPEPVSVDSVNLNEDLVKWRDAQIEAGRMDTELFDEWVKVGETAAAERDSSYETWLADVANTSLRGASEELRELVVDHARPIATDLGLRATRKKGDRTRSEARSEKAKQRSETAKKAPEIEAGRKDVQSPGRRNRSENDPNRDDLEV